MFVQREFLPSLLVWFATFASAAHAATQYTLTTLASFDGINGSSPRGGVVLDSSGNLYGTTASGGDSFDSGVSYGDNGTVFRLDPETGVLATLVSFDLDNGINPVGGLIFDAAGNLYGTTLQGYGSGASIFRLNPASGTFATLVRFTGDYSGNLADDLIFDANGNLYGTSPSNGGGWVFRFDPVGGVLTKLASFNGDNGIWPSCKLIFDASGDLYGTTSMLGPYGHGTVFRLDPVSGVLTTLASFNGVNGSSSGAGLVFDSSGNLYGTTGSGGDSFDGVSSFGNGTVFRLNPVSGVLTTLVSFNGNNGREPSSDLIFDSSGNLYGTTSRGGEFDYGTVFRLDPVSGEMTTLVSFNGANGVVPYASLIFDSSGNLYGTTSGGGVSDHGTVFQLSPVSESLPGDFDLDGDVDGADFLTWQRGESPRPLSPLDLTNWRNGFGDVAPAAGSIPEPSAILLLAPAALWHLLKPSRRTALRT